MLYPSLLYENTPLRVSAGLVRMYRDINARCCVGVSCDVSGFNWDTIDSGAALKFVSLGNLHHDTHIHTHTHTFRVTLLYGQVRQVR